MRALEKMRKLCSVQRVVLSGVLVRQITTYVRYICRTVSTSGVCMIHAYPVCVCVCVCACVCAREELSGPDRVSLHDKQLLRSGMRAGQSGK